MKSSGIFFSTVLAIGILANVPVTVAKDRFVHYASPTKFAEKVQKIPLTRNAGKSPKKVVLSMGPFVLKRGQLVLVTSHSQFSNRFNYTGGKAINVGMSGVLILSDSPRGTTGIELTEATGTNISPKRHHDARYYSTQYLVNRTFSKPMYVNSVYWGYSTKAKTGDYIKVDQDYSRMEVTIFNP